MPVRKGSLGYWFLYSLEKAISGYIVLDNIVASPYKYRDGPDLIPIKKSSLIEAIRRLRQKGYIEREKNEGKIILKLTETGKDFLGKDAPWDGVFRIVVWDIPENKRRIRDLFRRRLKEWGFKNWQRSVWVSKRNVTDKLRNLIQELDIGEWAAVIESSDSSLSKIIFEER